MGTFSHAPEPLSGPPADESAIRHHERQLCAAELLILAERNTLPLGAQGILRVAAEKIARRGVQV